jgi:mannose-1-phosphate guanylyltransferase
MSNNFVVIMAGGIGSRFWPYSRTAKPKQFLDILGIGETLIQSTYKRFRNIAPAENILVVTSDIYLEIVKEQLPELPAENILAEPMRRNTAPCIALSNAFIERKNKNAKIVVTPADHFIPDMDVFEKTILDGIEFVSKNDALLTLGIKPTRPETGYGYIQADANNVGDIYKVKTFTEKPNREVAEMFLKSGEFTWNSGIFLWSLDSINRAFRQFQPDIFETFKSISNFTDEALLEKIYSTSPSISIDYGVMEHADNVYVMEAHFRWSDLGTWSALFDNSSRNSDNNVLNSPEILTYQVENTVAIVTGKKTVILDGLKNYIFVETEDVIMVCRKQEEQNIKQIVNDIKNLKKEYLL